MKTKSLGWSKVTAVLIFAIFIYSRFLTWQWKPLNFSEIIYSYMPYAHLWASGTRPYLDQWYEYPPGTIPIFYLPHLYDFGSLHQRWHLDYGQFYRLEMLVFDTGSFLLVWLTLNKLKVKKSLIWFSLGYYMLATLKAHDFIYDTMDISFAFFILASCVLPILLAKWPGQLGGWISYFVAVSLKLLNAPLGLLYWLMDKKQLKKSLIWAIVAGILVWGIPLVMYRSSLRVLLVYQNIRGLQIDSAGAIVARIIDQYSHSEKVIEVYKNYEFSGPVSTNILHVLNILLLVSIGLYLLYFAYQIWRAPKVQPAMRIVVSLGLIFLLMLVSKVLSRPFMLWHIPLLAVFPFKSIKEQILVLITSFIAVAATLSAIPNTLILGWPLPLWVGIVRTLCYAGLLVWLLRASKKMVSNTTA